LILDTNVASWWMLGEPSANPVGLTRGARAEALRPDPSLIGRKAYEVDKRERAGLSPRALDRLFQSVARAGLRLE
jgi:hypothetical protein